MTRNAATCSIHEIDHRLTRADAAVEHAIEHVLDFPAELTERGSANQASGSLEGVERSADRRQLIKIGGVGLPARQLLLQVADLLADFLEEDVADVIVDFIADLGGKAGGQEFGRNRHLFLDLFLDLDPLILAVVFDRRSLGRRQAQPGQILRRCLQGARFADHEIGHIGARQHFHVRLRVGGLRCGADNWIVVAGRSRRRLGGSRWHHGRWRRGRRVRLRRQRSGRDVGVVAGLRDARLDRRRRPVAKRLQAVAGDVEDGLAIAPVFARRIEVVLDRSQRIGQAIHLLGRRHAPMRDQLDLHEAHDRGDECAGIGEIEHAQRAGDLFQQFGDALDPRVIPRRFDEGDDVLLGLLQVDAGLAHQRVEHAAALGLRQRGLAGRLFTGCLADAVDVVVERCFHVQQRAGDVEQCALVDRALAACHLLEHLALVVDHATRHAEPEHAEGVADAVERFGLGLEVARIGVLAAQVDVERLLDAQQIVLDGGRYGIEQRAVAARHRALRMFEFGLGRQQRIELVDAADLRDARRAGAGGFGLREVVEQVLAQLAWRARRERGLAAVGKPMDLAVDATEQQLDRHARLQAAVGDAVGDAGGDPPQTTRLDTVRQAAQTVEHLAEAAHMFECGLVAEPLEQGRLEGQPQAQRLRTQLGLRQLACGASRRVGQRRGKVGREQGRFAQQVLAEHRAQIVEQRQQDDRNVLVAALQALEVIGQLHHAAHEHRVGLVALAHGVGHERIGDALHVLDHHRRAVQLDHAQGALHLVQVTRAVAQRLRVVGFFHLEFERFARLGERGIECRFHPAQRSEGTIVVKFHAVDLDGEAACDAGAPSRREAVVQRGGWRLLITFLSLAA